MADGRLTVGFVPVGFVGDGVGLEGVGVEGTGVEGAGKEGSGVGSAVPEGAVSVHPTRAAAITTATTHRPTIIGT